MKGHQSRSKVELRQGAEAEGLSAQEQEEEQEVEERKKVEVEVVRQDWQKEAEGLEQRVSLEILEEVEVSSTLATEGVRAVVVHPVSSSTTRLTMVLTPASAAVCADWQPVG